MPKTSSPAPATSLLLKVELTNIAPIVWRKVVVPDTISLPALHDVIQIAMGWEDCHMHEFNIAEEPVKSGARTRLGKLLDGVSKFRYDYDFGDGWEHEITVEKVFPTDTTIAVCIDGANACPPEDIGGPWGYANFLEAIADPRHENHDEFLEMCGGRFDATAFDLEAVNAELQRLKV